MNTWPSSVSDYKWPRGFTSSWQAPGRWMRAALFHAAYLAGRFVSLIRPNHRAVLAIRTDGIGDAVLAEPMLASFAGRFSGCQMHLWAPDAIGELYRAAPYVNRFRSIPRGFKDGNLRLFRSRSLRLKLGYLLGRWQFETVAYLAHSPEPLGNWLFSSARARQRWYVAGDMENQFATQRLNTSRVASSLFSRTDVIQFGRNDLTRNARVAAQWGDRIEHRAPAVYLDEAAAAAAAEQCRIWRNEADQLEAAQIVGLMPVASMAVKKYPPGAWAVALAELWRTNRVICALLGGSNDLPAIEELSVRLGKLPHLRLARPLDLPAMSALIGFLDGFLGVDTGLAHVAMAMDIPTVTIVGGGHPGRFLPWPIPRRAKVLNHSMPCEGCANRCHLNRAECVTRVDPMEIVRAMTGLICPTEVRPLRIAG